MTLTEIRSFVKNNYRLANTELDTVLDANINEAWREISRCHFWPGLLKGATFVTTSSQFYDVEDDFDVLIRNSVRIDVTSSSPGYIIPDVGANEIVLLDACGQSYGPSAVCIRHSATGLGKELYFSPTFTQTGFTVVYRYRATPAILTAGDDIPEEISCSEPIAWWTLQTMAQYHGKGDDADRFEARYRKALSRALMQAGNLV